MPQVFLGVVITVSDCDICMQRGPVEMLTEVPVFAGGEPLNACLNRTECAVRAHRRFHGGVTRDCVYCMSGSNIVTRWHTPVPAIMKLLEPIGW